MQHSATGGSRKRTYQHGSKLTPDGKPQAKDSRLASTTIGDNPTSYSYDADGNFVSLGDAKTLAWNGRGLLDNVTFATAGGECVAP